MQRAGRSAAGARLLLGGLVVLLGGCAAPEYFRAAGAAPELAPMPLAAWAPREIWTGLVFNGEKVGFTHRSVRPARGAPGRYEIASEAVMRLRFLGFDKHVRLRALDRVRADLTLESFDYEHEIDGSRLALSGASDGRTLAFTIENAGRKETKTLLLEKPLYPSSALGLLPVARGLAVGGEGRYLVFNGETQSLAEAEQRVLAFEQSELFEGRAFRTLTRLAGLETTTWFAPDGRPLFELAMRGTLISALEDEAAARRYLLEASLSRRDAIVDFSLIRAGPIPAPRRVSRLAVTLEGLPAGFAVPSGGGQSCARSGERVECRIDRAAPLAQDDPRRYLAPTLAAPSNLRQIAELAGRIAGDAGTAEAIERLLAWIDANIDKQAIDAFSATDVLRERRAECQGHSYLLAALARARGIPARVVNGIVYSEAHGGFLYHTWNELWIAGRGWRAVDATFGQALADATHLKLVEGESPAEVLPLAALIGRLRVVSVSALARW